MPTLLCHGILRISDAGHAAGIAPAVMGGRLVVSPAGGLAALASILPEDLDLEAVMADPDGVAQLAKGHNRVLVEFVQAGDIVPSRLDSFHSDEGSLTALMMRERAQFEAVLTRVAGCAEYEVRLEAQRPAEAPVMPAFETGRAYLAARRAARDRSAAARLGSQGLSDETLRALAAISQAIVQRKPPAATDKRVVLSLACLVERKRVEAFSDTIEDLAAEAERVGYRLLATGPWPPYHFATNDDGTDAGSDRLYR